MSSGFGEKLRREREARGVSLEDISKRTRIGIRFLQAIESEDLDQLPGGLFNKSFLRQYAACLGLQDDKVVQDYLHAMDPRPDPAAELAVVQTVADARTPQSSSWPPHWALGAALAAVVIAGVLYFTTRTRGAEEERPATIGSPVLADSRSDASSPQTASATAEGSELSTSSSPANSPQSDPVSSSAPSGSTPAQDAGQSTSVSHAEPAESTPAPVPSVPAAAHTAPLAPTAAASAASAPANVAVIAGLGGQPAGTGVAAPATPTRVPPVQVSSDGLLLQIDALQAVWLSITVDGDKKWQGTLQASESRQVQATTAIQVTLGNAGGVQMTLNGKPLGSLGRDGQVKTLTLAARDLPGTPR